MFIQVPINYLTKIVRGLSFDVLNLQQSKNQLKIYDINSEIKERVRVK